MSRPARELARHLARQVEVVCRYYLSNGRRMGRYWVVGDVNNTPGRSLYVRLHGPEAGRGAAGKWTDAATGEHGDLLDLIGLNRRLDRLGDILDEARRFLALPTREPPSPRRVLAPGSPGAAQRLFAAARPLSGTIAETYLRNRGITGSLNIPALRFHPRCFYRTDSDAHVGSWPHAWPALIAAVTDLDGRVTGVHRTWLDPAGRDKAPVPTPRRAMGQLLGNIVHLHAVAGPTIEVMAAGEGIETMLSLRCVLPGMPIVAALSAAHLAALVLPRRLRRLYIARDADAAGCWAAGVLSERAEQVGTEVVILIPRLGDFNEDLRAFGAEEMRAALRTQLVPTDVLRFLGQSRNRAS
jgi:hypothetical protein